MEGRISIITLGVKDLDRSIKFYKEGLGLDTSAEYGAEIAFFKTAGTCLALYPLDKLAEEFPDRAVSIGNAQGSPVTLAHNTRSKDEVELVLAQAEAAGGTIIKPAQLVFWGGFSGYFQDPDGHLWEVAYADSWQFNDDGSLVIE
ncbi:VOC family protein [Vibrio ulleungensis]|uniref:VOC family protein n=1 Tax=Vibrio ulleungensis TaxID=2807619 RepID=A0ABS2HC39_9VIBR|nr:VOC family protein [Vibrio ulleungensis]MBM7035160.1 VOC family protein [Vibrio ulleungensis]